MAALAAIDRVLDLTADWESAYGLELLATVLFAVRTQPGVVVDPNLAVEYIHRWNARKPSTFPAGHVTKAWQHLHNHGWLREAAT